MLLILPIILSIILYFYSFAITYYFYTIPQTLLHRSQYFPLLIISLLFDILHYNEPFLFPIILLLCLQASYYASNITTKFATYYSQNYAGI